MDRRIKNLVDIYFEDVPYSLEVIKAREVIEAALIGEYRRLLKEGREASAAFEEIVEKYGKLSGMAELVGYTKEDAARWRVGEAAREFSRVRRETRRQQRRIYGISFLAAAVLVELLWLVYDLFTKPLAAVFVLLLTALLAA